MTFIEKVRQNPRPYFINALIILFVFRFFLHVYMALKDPSIFTGTVDFSKVWAAYLIIADAATSVLLFTTRRWGIVAFCIVAVSQLIAHIAFEDTVGHDRFNVTFHVITLLIYAKIHAKEKRESFN